MKYLSLLFVALILGCNHGENYNENDGLAGLLNTSSSKEMVEAETIYVDEESMSPEPVTTNETQKIIKNANLRYETKDLEASYKTIVELTQTLDGMISLDNSGKSYHQFYRNITVRVPAKNFQSFLVGISKGVAYFDRKDISQQDVTEEFVDLEARLKAKRELETRYLELLKQAKNVKEMLEIERELSTIREEIEAKQGRLNYLQDRVQESTIHIEIYKATSATGVTVSYGQKMKNALSGGWDGISVFFLGLLYLWPLFLLVIIAILVIRRYVRSKRK